MVSSNVAIVLGIICIILLASLFGVILSFEYQSQADNVAAQRLDRSIVYANNQTLYLQAGGYYSWYQIAEHSGYWSVDVQSSTNKTYVQVEYSWLSAAIESLNYGAHQISFENMTYIGTSGQVNFATVVGTQCGIRVGNNNTDIGANVTVTIVYYY